MMQTWKLIALTLLICPTAPLHLNLASAAEPVRPPQAPKIASASDEGQRALGAFRIPTGFKGSLFAAEPMLANPVAFFVNRQGKVYVCETFRQKKGVEDNRSHAHWLDDDLAAQTVEDRLAYIKKHLGERAIEYTKQDDRIRLLADSDGDGRADKSTVFADGFNEIVAGTGAGVLEHEGNVYFTCIPNLWLLRDEDNDGRADVRKSLHYGFGVRFAFRGHDMHGLIVGPDGRLYFSIGDRGYNVRTPNGRLKNPDSGAVFRCELDGSNLEVFAMGLRNPQELAFDDYGNLFTGDNNSDSGDKARWVNVVEGGDSGWRMYYQYLSDRGPFNREKIWHPFHEGQPAFIVPPVANVADGPSGLAYYPGTGSPEDFNGRFFLCDFRGGAANSGVRSFRVKPKGAFFELIDQDQPFWNILATDIAFASDGSVLISDWVHGWDGLGKGRIYRFASPVASQAKESVDVKHLLADGLSEFSDDELIGWLGYGDQRVRQMAQFELVKRNEPELMAKTALDKEQNLLGRLHALWGLGQLARKQAVTERKLRWLFQSLLRDPHPEIRAQAARVICDSRISGLQQSLLPLLKDDSLRVRYFAALAIGKSGRNADCVEPLLSMLAENKDQDPIVRHGGIMGLVGCADAQTLVNTADHHSSSARIGAVVALRKRHDAGVSAFLNDGDERVVVEAARAIHDEPLDDAMYQLAKLIERTSESEPLLRRVLNANYRLGGRDHAAAIARFAARDRAPTPMRVEALQMLANWNAPSNRDRVLGAWRPLPRRDKNAAAEAIRKSLAGIIGGPEPVRDTGAKVAAKLGIAEAAPVLRQLLQNEKLAGQSRADALGALGELNAKGLANLVETALDDKAPEVRTVARDVLVQFDSDRAVKALEQAISSTHLRERQGALATLGKVKSQKAAQAIESALQKLNAGKIPLDTRLDLLEAARRRNSKGVQDRLAAYYHSLPDDDPLAKFRTTLAGGNAQRGANLFFERRELSCVRCHTIDGRGGEVGPNLSAIGKDKEPEYLLEAIALPNRSIAKGFESVVVITDDGLIRTGIVRHEDDKVLRIMTATGEEIEIDQETIEARRAGESSMPADLIKHLSLFELRDLIAFLSSRKEKQAGNRHR